MKIGHWRRISITGNQNTITYLLRVRIEFGKDTRFYFIRSLSGKNIFWISDFDANQTHNKRDFLSSGRYFQCFRRLNLGVRQVVLRSSSSSRRGFNVSTFIQQVCSSQGGSVSPAPVVHVRQLLHPWVLLHQAGVLRAVSGLQQRGVRAQRQTEPGPERHFQVLRCDPVTWLPVPHQHRDVDAAGRQQLQRLQTVLHPGPLHLVPMVLEPDLHLVRSQADQSGQVLPLWGGQVALLTEAALQLEGLRFGEEDAPLPAAALLRSTSCRVSIRLRGFICGQLRRLGLGAGI